MSSTQNLTENIAPKFIDYLNDSLWSMPAFNINVHQELFGIDWIDRLA